MFFKMYNLVSVYFHHTTIAKPNSKVKPMTEEEDYERLYNLV
jgi:hypothetical protein